MRYPFDGSYPITQKFGQQNAALTGGTHKGTDYGLPLATPVKAITAGQVILTGHDASRGNHISIKSGDTIHRYYHLSQVLIPGGAMVTEGQTIGSSGKTGLATGPHLHLQTERNGAPVDPEQVIKGATIPPSPPASNFGTLYLPASAERWRVYPLNVIPRVGNEKGFILPAMFGGLSYKIQARPNANVAIIDTRDFGRVQIWIAPDTGATVR